MRVLQFLAAGMLFNCLAQVPMVVTSTFGRTDVIAKLQLFEIPLYLPVLYGAIVLLGIEGAAAVWMLRMLIETVDAFLLAARFFPELRKTVRSLFAAAPLSLAKLAMGSIITGLAWKLVYVCLVLILLAPLGWRSLGPGERNFFVGPLRPLGARLGLRTQR